MAHFAKLDANNLVIDVIVVSNEVVNNLPFPESEEIGINFCRSLYGNDTNWKQTSYNNSFRKHYASCGYTYDARLDAFIPPQPYIQCRLDEELCEWICPSPVLTDDGTMIIPQDLP